MTRPVVLVWLNEADVYRDAVARAGLADRVELHAVAAAAEPEPALLARCEALLVWRVKRDFFGRAPRLRWVQALTAGVEGWLERGLPPGLALTCARGTHRLPMPDNILVAV